MAKKIRDFSHFLFALALLPPVALSGCADAPDEVIGIEETYPENVKVIRTEECRETPFRMRLPAVKKNEPIYVVGLDTDQQPTETPWETKTFRFKNQMTATKLAKKTKLSFDSKTSWLSKKKPSRTPKTVFTDSHLDWLNAQRDFEKALRARGQDRSRRRPGLKTQSKGQLGKCPGPYLPEETRCVFKVLNVAEYPRPKEQMDVSATLRLASSSFLFFVDDTAAETRLLTKDELTGLSRFLETNGKPSLEEFGNFSDIDGNGKIIVLLTDKIGASFSRSFAYVTTVDLYRDGSSETYSSNEAEITYVMLPNPVAYDTSQSPAAARAQYVSYGLPLAITHELKHLISNHERILARDNDPEESWIEEGSAVVAQNKAALSAVEQPLYLEEMKTYLKHFAHDVFDDVSRYQLAVNQPNGASEYTDALYLMSSLFLTSAHGHTKANKENFWKALLQNKDAGQANASRITNIQFPYLMLNFALDLLYSSNRFPSDRFGRPFAQWKIDLADRAIFPELYAQKIDLGAEGSMTGSALVYGYIIQDTQETATVELELNCPDGGYMALVRPMSDKL